MSTIFTKIIEDEIPCHKIAETDDHIVFLDINPIAEAHTLVVPKKEIDYFFDLPDELMQDTMNLSRSIVAAIDKALQPLRTGIIVQGLEVPHAHLHLIPLYTKTQPMALGHNVSVSEERMVELKEQIVSHISL